MKNVASALHLLAMISNTHGKSGKCHFTPFAVLYVHHQTSNEQVNGKDPDAFIVLLTATLHSCRLEISQNRAREILGMRFSKTSLHNAIRPTFSIPHDEYQKHLLFLLLRACSSTALA
jgi:hypothetical protein